MTGQTSSADMQHPHMRDERYCVHTDCIPLTIDVLAGDNAVLWQLAWRSNDERILARHPLTPVLLVRLPRPMTLRWVLPVAVQRWAVLAGLHQGQLPLQQRIHCGHGLGL